MPPTPTRSRKSSSSSSGKVLVFLEDGAGSARRRCSARGTACRCPANVIHGFVNVGLEPAYLQVMLGKAKPRPHDLRGRVAAVPPRRAPGGASPLVARPPVLVGASLKRKEDGRLVAGLGRYLDDLQLPELLHLGPGAQPPRPCPRSAIDGAAARGLDGVMAVLDARRLAGAGPPRCRRSCPSRAGGPIATRRSPGARVRHVGEPSPSWWPTIRIGCRRRGAGRSSSTSRCPRRDAGPPRWRRRAPRARRLAGQCRRT